MTSMDNYKIHEKTTRFCVIIAAFITANEKHTSFITYFFKCIERFFSIHKVVNVALVGYKYLIHESHRRLKYKLYSESRPGEQLQ